MKKPPISFFCPAYYDEVNLPILIPKVFKVLKNVSSAFEIVIVEDGSPDNTGKVADKLAIAYKPFIKVVHHTHNMGYGVALRSGFSNAKKFDYVFYTDGDMQYEVEELSKMVPYLKDYEVVIGFRSKRALTPTRQVQAIVFNWIVSLLFGLHVKDINCSMKIASRDALNKINLTSNGAFIDAELLIKLKNQGYKFKEVEVTHLSRKFGKASGGSVKVIFKTLSEMFKFYLNKDNND